LNFTLQGAAAPDLNRTIAIAPSAPVIRNAKVVRNATGFEMRVSGFSTSKKVTQATVRFAGSGLQTTELAVPLQELAGNWYRSPASIPFGSQFSLVLPFTIQGNPN